MYNTNQSIKPRGGQLAPIWAGKSHMEKQPYHMRPRIPQQRRTAYALYKALLIDDGHSLTRARLLQPTISTSTLRMRTVLKGVACP